MRIIIIMAGMASLLWLAIPGYAQYRSDSCGCPIPVEDTSPVYQDRVLPNLYERAQSLSPDGKHLAVLEGDGGAAFVLNLQTLELTQIFVTGGGLPHFDDVFYGTPFWCPYNPDLLALNVVTLDPHNNGSADEVPNIYTYKVSTGESNIITPDTYGPFVGAGLISWIVGSHPGSDTLMIGYSQGIEKYVPQTQSLIPEGPDPGLPGTIDTVAFSQNSKHSLSYWQDTNIARNKHIYYLDGSELHLPRTFSLQAVSFSPDSKLVALSVEPTGVDNGDTIFNEVWIFSSDIASPTNVMVINFQCLFCMYNFDYGADAVFLTDSTLAVSMHKDLADTAALYEITIDGRMVRQLTYAAKSGVLNATLSSFSLNSRPNPFSRSTQISFTSPDAGYADISIVNLLGEQVARIFSGELDAGEHNFTFSNTAALPDGIYDCLIRMNGHVENLDMLLLH